jgi:phenylacetate-coenzyme A ligase PaaK-like adenylate-forming protein
VKYTDHLLSSNPFDFTTASENLFVKSFQEMALHHYNHNSYFKFIWDNKKIHPKDILTEKDLERVPMILVNQFKEHDFKSSENIVLTLGSSGTSGQRSVQHLDQYSLDNVKKLAFKIHDQLGMVDKQKYNYLCFTYDPEVANDLGTAFTDELLTSFTQVNEIYYTFQFDKQIDDFKMNVKEVVETLKRFELSPYPTRILGFPAFLNEIVDEFDLKLNLGDDSWIQTGGGWKSKADEEIPKDEFRIKMSKALGLPKENIRDLFGMVEHGIPYVDCRQGKLRIPNYSRVFIRDPKTLEILPHGEIGLIQFLCSYNSSYPAMSILTTDWGCVHLEGDSTSSLSLEIKGRAGVSKNKGCALKALEVARG